MFMHLQSVMGPNLYVAFGVFAFAVWAFIYAKGPKLTREQKAQNRADSQE